MKKKNIYLFFISFCVLFLNLYAQESKKDTIVLKDTYGIRVGLDLYNPIYTIFDSNRKSLEIVGDYRLAKKYYIAVELGYLDNKIEENYYNVVTKGQYLKLGINYNLYKNWLDMDNDIYIGLRYGFSNFSQEVDNITINSAVTLPEFQLTTPKKWDNLNANWGELVVGTKAAIFKNVYLGFSFSVKKMIKTKEPDNFKNIYVPGFNRVYLNDGGFGFNYTISYRLPIYKKNKVTAIKAKELETK